MIFWARSLGKDSLPVGHNHRRWWGTQYNYVIHISLLRRAFVLCFSVQKIPVLSLILLYSFGWVAGLLMDSCIRKTVFVFAAQICATIGLVEEEASLYSTKWLMWLTKWLMLWLTGILLSRFGYQAAIILSLPQHTHCEKDNSTNNLSISCQIDEFTWCLKDHGKGSYCLDVYVGWACAIAVVSAVVRTALPALGGDQVLYNHFLLCKKIFILKSEYSWSYVKIG